MKVIGICGSPREKGNTEFFIQTTLDKLNNNGVETELIRLKGKNISGCNGCYRCVEKKECVIEDDFQELFQKMMSADGILLGSPVYHSSITPKLKGLLDRAGFLGRWVANEMKDNNSGYQWKGSAFSGKLVAPITVARRAGQNFTFAQLLLWATVNDCIVVGSNYWNVGVAGTSGKIDAENDIEGIGIMEHLADNMTYILKQFEK
ncbi:flavodoxin family protein [Clostridiisalibacter paucivorans]|uniref:flavodoxin family protein n=1 Tax=Clostridiisalibacter paucivorans TaxID=408753 RepID=UPI00047D8DED|nr:flavodoxin family protein [Clostridiisalibacter paucivorans]